MRRSEGDRSEERQDKGEESKESVVHTIIISVPFQLQDFRQSKTEPCQSDDDEDDDAVVAEEGEDKGEREEPEEDVGQEEDRRLQPLEQGGVF